MLYPELVLRHMYLLNKKHRNYQSQMLKLVILLVPGVTFITVSYVCWRRWEARCTLLSALTTSGWIYANSERSHLLLNCTLVPGSGHSQSTGQEVPISITSEFALVSILTQNVLDLYLSGGGGWTWLGETLALFSDLIMQAVVWVQYRSDVYPQCRIGEESWRVWRWLIIPDPSSFASTVLLNHVLIYATSIEYF